MKIGIRFDFKKVSGNLESLESLEVLGTINICMCIYIHTCTREEFLRIHLHLM